MLDRPPENNEYDEIIDISTTYVEYRRPWLYAKQTEATFDPHRIACIEASTKAGKTVSCISWLLEQAMMGGGEGRNYWWVAPVAAQAEIAFTRILRFLPQGTYRAHRGVKTVTLINGAIIWFKGADRPDTLYGDDVYAAVIDEASRVKSEAWVAVRSTLTFTKGPIRLIGNVRGRKNWFYTLARRAQAGDPNMGYHKITAYDAVAAGVLDAQEIADAKSVLPDHVFKELYLAEASDDGGNPFGLAAIQKCIGHMSNLPPRVWGWDLAKKQDYTVGIALDMHGVVCRFERFQIDWGQTTQRIIQATGRTPALVDSTGVGDPIVENLQRVPGTKFEGYQFTQPSKQKLMEGLASAIQSSDIVIPPDATDRPLVFELEQFEYELTRTGVRYSAPSGFHDDCVVALALASIHKGHTKPPLSIPQSVLARSAFPR